MSKKIKLENYISAELKDVETKVIEFQAYLKTNSIVSKVSNGSEILLSEENQDKLHKEILVQIKMQDAVFAWLPLLHKLRELNTEAAIETRGDVPINGLFKNRSK